jgi:Flp pilus assembly protein TadD
MRLLAVLISFFAWLMGASPMLAAVDRDWNDCKADDTARSIAGCTRIIQGRGETNKNHAIAYNTRGVAYRAKGDFDRAIADFNEAIRLDPKYASPYNNRGVAFQAKGDLDRAMADFNEAIQLDATLAQAYNNRGSI